MRKAFAIAITLLLLSSPAWAGFGYTVYGGGHQAVAAGGACADTASGDYGNTATDGSNFNVSQNQILVTEIDLSTDEGEDPTLYAYIQDNNLGSAANYKWVIYDDDGGSGEPGSLLYVSDSILIDQDAFAWDSLSSSGTGCLTGKVWVGVILDGAIAPGLKYNNTGANTRYISNADFTPPETWDTDSDLTSTNARSFYMSFP
ncbi:MAG: hypothetical protein ACOWWM_12690 [Desulfobacterales bacterium]